MAVVLALTTTIIAPLDGAAPDARRGPPSTMTIVTPEEPDTLDPQKSDTAVSDIILRYVGDPLVRLDA